MVCDGKHINITPFSLASLMSSRDMCERCPSTNNKTGPDLRRPDTAGRTSFLNHSRTFGRSIHPDSEAVSNSSSQNTTKEKERVKRLYLQVMKKISNEIKRM